MDIEDDDVINLRPRQQLSTAVAMCLERSGHEPGISGGKAQQMEGVAIAQEAAHEGGMIGQGKVVAQELSAVFGVDLEQAFERPFGFGGRDGNAIQCRNLNGVL